MKGPRFDPGHLHFFWCFFFFFFFGIWVGNWGGIGEGEGDLREEGGRGKGGLLNFCLVVGGGYLGGESLDRWWVVSLNGDFDFNNFNILIFRNICFLHFFISSLLHFFFPSLPSAQLNSAHPTKKTSTIKINLPRPLFPALFPPF